MGHKFDMALSNWKQAFENYQADLAEQRMKRPATDIHKVTHDRFKDQARQLIIAQQGRAAA